MKAAFIEQTGSPDSIIIGDLPVPEISAHQVLVRVTYTTVNHVDCYIRSGKYVQAMPKPFIIGRDFCGDVVKVGKELTQFKVGDRVWSNCQGIHQRQGTFAELLAVDGETLFSLPPKADPIQAVAGFHSAFTAILGLEREAKLQKNDILYIHGAAGNIGAAVIQAAKFYGAKVIASTHGKEKTEYCYTLGADEVIDYKEDIQTALKHIAPGGVNVIWNTSRIHDFKLMLPLLAAKGRYILMAGSGSEAVLPVGELYTKDASICGFAITNATLKETQDAAAKINSMLEKQSLRTKIAQILPLKATQEAHAIMEAGEIWGKIIIEVG